jgi:hypothetical protein
MTAAKLSFFALSGALFAAAIGACGGRVIVDGIAGDGGAGGLGGAVVAAHSGATTGSSTLSGPGCNFPTPVGNLQSCSTAESTGTTLPASCATSWCDQVNNQFFANCTGLTCVCSFHPATGDESFGCTCSLPGSCDTVKTTCCPFPF